MEPLIGQASKYVELDAVVWPSCKCGLPWEDHQPCGGYIPSKPVRNLGTIHFKHPDLLATLYWKLEAFFKNLRHKRVTKCHLEQEQ